MTKEELFCALDEYFDKKGNRYFTLSVDNHTGDAQRHGVTSSDVTPSVTPRRETSPGDDAQRHGGMTPSVTSPKNPYIGDSVFLQCINTNTKEGADSTALQPPAPNTECVSVSGETALPQPQPKTQTPEDIKRMASQLGLEGWIGELSFQGESLQDWRVRETLGLIYAQGGKKGSRYAWGIYRNLPKEQPASGYTSIANKEQQEAERIARNLARLDALR